MVSGLTLEYRINGAQADAPLQRMALAFERAGDKVADFGTFVFPKLIPVFEHAVEGQFDARGHGPNSGAWASLSRKYQEWKDRHAPGKGILELSGNLRSGLTSSSSPFAAREVGANDLTYGTRGLVYAGVHQAGRSNPFMPARPPFDFDGDFEHQVTDVTREGVRAALVDSGLAEVTELG